MFARGARLLSWLDTWDTAGRGGQETNFWRRRVVMAARHGATFFWVCAIFVQPNQPVPNIRISFEHDGDTAGH